MAKTLADGRTKLVFLAEAPTDPEHPTAAELNAGVDLSKAVLASPYTFGPSGSDALAEKSLADEGNSTTYGASNFTVAMTFFRYLLESGRSDPDADVAFKIFEAKGVHGWLYERWGPKSRVPFADGDEVRFGAEVTCDDPQAPTERTGYIKMVVPMGVDGQSVQNVKVGAAPAAGS